MNGTLPLVLAQTSAVLAITLLLGYAIRKLAKKPQFIAAVLVALTVFFGAVPAVLRAVGAQ